MPVHRVGNNCWQWGKKGKTYCGKGAKEKALKQEKAARANGWKGDVEELPVVGFEDGYSIDITGDIYSKPRKGTPGKKLVPIIDKDGYLKVNLSKDSKVTQHKVHILVAKTFLLNPDNKPTVNHIDGDRANPAVWNVEWATEQEQQDDILKRKKKTLYDW